MGMFFSEIMPLKIPWPFHCNLGGAQMGVGTLAKTNSCIFGVVAICSRLTSGMCSFSADGYYEPFCQKTCKNFQTPVVWTDVWWLADSDCLFCFCFWLLYMFQPAVFAPRFPENGRTQWISCVTTKSFDSIKIFTGILNYCHRQYVCRLRLISQIIFVCSIVNIVLI